MNWFSEEERTARASRGLAIAWAALFAGTAIVFLIPQLAKIFLVGNCCADDSYFSMIARTLIDTGRYGLPSSNGRISILDPAIGSGPALVVPGAAAILAFGPQRWVPGLTALITFVLQYTIFLGILARRFPAGSVLAYGALGLAVVFVATSYQDYFSQFLGEGPMTGYLLIGCALLALPPATWWRVLLSGLSFGFAILVKDIAIFCVAGACVAWLVAAFIGRRRFVWHGILLASAAAFPFVAFEALKIAILGGVQPYLANKAAYLSVLRDYSVLGSDDRLGEFLTLMSRSYQLNFGFVALTVAALIAITLLARHNGVARLGWIMLGAAIVELAYMLFFSRMTPRYAFSGVMMACFILPLPLLVLKDAFKAVFIVVASVLFCTPAAISKSYDWQMRQADGRYVVEQAQVLQILSEHPKRRVMGQSWHSFFDIAYLLPPDRPWRVSNDETVISKFNGFVVFNPFVGRDYPIYETVVTTCTRIEPQLEIYEFYRCFPTPAD